MKTIAGLAGLCWLALLASGTGAEGEIKGMLGSDAKIVNQEGKLLASYSYAIQTDRQRIKTPLVFMVIMTEEKPANRKIIKLFQSERIEDWEQAELSNDAICRMHSNKKSEVDISSVRAMALQDFELNMVNYRLAPTGQVLLWRIELWCDGKMLACQTNAEPEWLARLNVPEDWPTCPPGAWKKK